jgi:hypothetical protein
VYTALSKTPHALADGLMLVFQHPVKGVSRFGFRIWFRLFRVGHDPLSAFAFDLNLP